jgi:cytosine/adenosine deaminase-related metal-dependent hydrolase
MEGRLLLKGCSIFRADGRIRGGMAVLIEHDRIAKVAPDAEIPALPGDWEVACRGRLVATGLIDCHTHLVGGQLVPLSGALLLRSPKVRFEVLQRMESTLTAGEVEALTAFAVAKALRAGISMVVEHLHAPSEVAQSLMAQARVAQRLGIRLVNSHATNSLPRPVSAAAQFEANAAYAQETRAHPLVRGAVGFHASFCSDDELLRQIGRFRSETGIGAHFHLAESDADLAATYARHAQRIVPRLEALGILGAGSVGAFGHALDQFEGERLAMSRTLLAMSPRWMLATEHTTNFEALVPSLSLIGLGTGGTSSLWEELSCAFLAVMGIARMGRLLDPDGLMAQLLVGGPAELCSMLYGAPSGTVEAGSLADLVVYDLVPAKETLGGLTPHLLMQLAQAPVAWNIVNGRVVVREGQLLGADFLQLSIEAARVLETVWARA